MTETTKPRPLRADRGSTSTRTGSLILFDATERKCVGVYPPRDLARAEREAIKLNAEAEAAK